MPIRIMLTKKMQDKFISLLANGTDECEKVFDDTGGCSVYSRTGVFMCFILFDSCKWHSCHI